MIKGLEGMFKKADNKLELEKNSEKFEETLFKGIHALERLNVAYEEGQAVYDNESIKRSMSEEKHVALSLTYAAQSLTWADLREAAAFAKEIRSLYKEIYKKDAVTAASVHATPVALTPTVNISRPILPMTGTGTTYPINPNQTGTSGTTIDTSTKNIQNP